MHARRLPLIILLAAFTLRHDSAQANTNLDQCIAWFQTIVRTHPSVGAISTDAVNAFDMLRRRGKFLTQDAYYLKQEQCGGTCASVSMVNNMLVMEETLRPGAISNLNTFRTQTLHRRLMKEFLAELQTTHNIDGTNGARLKEFDGIYPRILQRVFGHRAASGLNVQELAGTAFQSVQPGKDSLLILSVNFGESNHAVVVTEIKKPAMPRSQDHVIPEDFIVTISDPHAPGKFKDLKVYEKDGDLYLEGYGGPSNLVSIQTYGRSFPVNAGVINSSAVINYKPVAATRSWTQEDINSQIVNGKSTVAADVILKNGTRLHDVKIARGYEPTKLFFFHRFIERMSVPLDEIADIQFLSEAK